MNRASSTASNPPPPEHDPYAALRLRDFRLYLTGMFLSNVGLHMQTVAVGWYVYERTGNAFAIGLVGLVQVVPVIFLALIAGHVADRLNRKHVTMATLVGIAGSSIGLAIVSILHAPIAYMYLCLFAAGVARAFMQPARASLLPQIVPRNRFTNALTWATTGFQLAAVVGPATAGFVIALVREPTWVFIYDAVAALAFCTLLTQVRHKRQPVDRQPLTMKSLAAGVRFVTGNPIILGAIGLDMFAVLLGGAVALLPIYAEDILGVGPTGLGWMQAMPAIGALLMSFIQSHRPPLKHAGRALLLAVTGFGLATIVFGFSRWFPLSLAMLFLTGALDNISVVVRHSLVQLLTPDAMRGRVSAINGLFISMSNELGAFESGTVAGLFSPSRGFNIGTGATIAVVSGGIGTLFVVAAAAWLLPPLRRYGRLEEAVVPEPAPVTNPM